MSGAYRRLVAQRPGQPAAQEPTAHGGGGVVQHPGQGVLGAAGQALGQLQVAAGGGVQDHCRLPVLRGQAAQVGEGGALGVADILEQAAGRPHCQAQGRTAEAAEVAGAELFAQGPLPTVRVEVPGRTAGQAPVQAPLQTQGLRQAAVLGQQDLGGPQAHQFAPQRLQGLDLQDREAPTRQLQGGQTVAGPSCVRIAALIAMDVLGNGDQQVLLALVEQGLVGQGPRCDDAAHLPLDRSLGLGRVTDLLADGHRDPLAHQPGQVALGRMIRHPGHRDRLSGRGPTLGEGDVQQCGRALRVLVEQFVEVAHAEEQQHPRVLRLEAQVLLHHRGVLGLIRGHNGEGLARKSPQSRGGGVGREERTSIIGPVGRERSAQ